MRKKWKGSGVKDNTTDLIVNNDEPIEATVEIVSEGEQKMQTAVDVVNAMNDVWGPPAPDSFAGQIGAHLFRQLRREYDREFGGGFRAGQRASPQTSNQGIGQFIKKGIAPGGGIF